MRHALPRASGAQMPSAGEILSSSVRPASAAGLYYPGDAASLRDAVQALLGREAARGARLPKALIVPHSGYEFSGAVAAAAYRTLSARAATIRHVVVLGPGHHVSVRGLAMPSHQYFATPCGVVAIDNDARARLRELGLAGVADAPHAFEHSIEVQLPFLQELLHDFEVLPIIAGATPAGHVARALEAVWGGPDTLVVVSTDLSHHHTQAEACQLDEQTVSAIVSRRSDLADAQACGAAGINGLLELARCRSLDVTLCGSGTSGDTAGELSRVVGYAGFALYAPSG